jgi:hypothetical protein
MANHAAQRDYPDSFKLLRRLAGKARQNTVQQVRGRLDASASFIQTTEPALPGVKWPQKEKRPWPRAPARKPQ